jgi:hypothetical protein
MLAGRCCSKLSDQKTKKSQALSEAPHRIIAWTVLYARSRRTPAMLILSVLFEAFQPPRPQVTIMLPAPDACSQSKGKPVVVRQERVSVVEMVPTA